MDGMLSAIVRTFMYVSVVSCSSEQFQYENYEAATYLSPDGTQIEVHNVSGCFPDFLPSDLVCDGAGFFTPVRNIFIFHLPDISSQTINQTCVRDSQDCRYEDTPGKDLINYFLICQHTRRCTGNRFGQTYVTRDAQLDCQGFDNRQKNIYSYFSVFEYMCIPDDWVVDMTVETNKTGAAVFLRKNYRFQVDNSQGYNISCSMTANDVGATIVIRSIDLRLCINSHPCDQVLRISDGTTTPFIFKTNDEEQERWLGSPVIFESGASTVMLTLDSGLGQEFSAWFYVSPSSGEVTVTCERPIYFTTTTTTSTTTTTPRPSTAAPVTKPSTARTTARTTAVANASDASNIGKGQTSQIASAENDSTLQLILMYERIAVTVQCAIFLFIFLTFVFACYIWRTLERRHKLKLRRQGDGRAYNQLQLPKGGNVYPANPAYRNPGFVQEDERNFRSKDYKAQSRDRAREQRPRPPNTQNDRIPSKSRKTEGSQVTAGSAYGAREKLLDMVVKGVKAKPELEKSLRETAGGSQGDIRVILGKLETRQLRDAYEEIKKAEEYDIIEERM